MLITQKRPRDLSWYHAGPLLFGDWGTSRLYVLGLAFYYTGHASVIYLTAISLLMAAVAWAYTVVCRSFPEGGGVYAAARQVSPLLSVIGATLLLCDYIVTAGLSAVEGFHYFGVHERWVLITSLVTIAAIGFVNWFGAKQAGRLALVIAVAAIVVSAVVAVLCIPMLPTGLRAMTVNPPGVTGWPEKWESFVRIVLALSGVEAVANMTGLMRQPVERTARRTIWPVLCEVIVLNLVFGIALSALPQLTGVEQPDYVTHEIIGKLSSDQVPGDVKAYRDTAVRLLAEHGAGRLFGEAAGTAFAALAGCVFGLLLLSAVNTAVMAMVSVMYSMSHDKELPSVMARLNYSGVPWVGLLVACALPTCLLVLEADPKALGELYAIGVVGAISINVLSCAWNKSLAMGPIERKAMWALGVFMSLVELTIVYAKPHAAVFAGIMISAVLAARVVVHAVRRRAEEAVQVAPPAAGWLAEIESTPFTIDPSKPRIMLAARGRYQSEFAVDLARRRRATLFVIFVRTLRVMDIAPGAVPHVKDDPDALESLGSVAVLARQYGVPIVPIYVTSGNIADEILDYTVTYGCDTLILGKTRRRWFSRAVAGDVVATVAQHLPDGVALLTRDSSPFVPRAGRDAAAESAHG